VKALTSEPDWKTLVSHLPENFEQLAIEHRLLNPQWPNLKVKSAEMLLRLILLHAGADLPLRQTVAIVAQGGGPSVTQVWLHQKMRHAHRYLAALVECMTVNVEQEASPERWAGYEMLGLDATTVSGPGAEGTDARIHAVIRLHDMRISEAHVTDASGGETLRRFGWMAGQLAIVDRGYSNAAGILHVVDQGADVLVRLNRGALPLYDVDENIVIDFVDHIISAAGISWLKTIASLGALVFLAVLAWRMVPPALDAMHFHEVSLDLSIPMEIYWVLMIFGILLALPVAAWRLVECLHGLRGGHEVR